MYLYISTIHLLQIPEYFAEQSLTKLVLNLHLSIYFRLKLLHAWSFFLLSFVFLQYFAINLFKKRNIIQNNVIVILNSSILEKQWLSRLDLKAVPINLV